MDNSQLEQAFAAHGPVSSATVITDRETGRSRGFGFVEMDDDAARAAIEALNGSDYDGRQLTVNEARPRNSR
jgi:RNA recognition motif-containing protein